MTELLAHTSPLRLRLIVAGGLLLTAASTGAAAFWISSTAVSTTDLGFGGLLTVFVLGGVSLCASMGLLFVPDLGADVPRGGAGTYRERFDATIARIRLRSESLRRGALVSSFLIFIALLGGLQLFYLASEISLTDVTKSYPVTAASTTSLTAPSSLELQRVRLTTSSASETRRLISTIAIRVGAVIVLGFLVQLLASLYRYNMRLANYFDARADALELSLTETNELKIDALTALTGAIAPETIEFYAGQMPPEVFADVIKALATRSPSKP